MSWALKISLAAVVFMFAVVGPVLVTLDAVMQFGQWYATVAGVWWTALTTLAIVAAGVAGMRDGNL